MTTTGDRYRRIATSILILKGFEEATTDEDDIEEGDEFKSKKLTEVHNS